VVKDVGISNLTLDSKNRFFVPKYLKKYKKFYITMGLDNCLLLYTPIKWDTIIQKFKLLSWSKEAHRKFLRMFLSRARLVVVDSQSRLLLPQDLIKHAKIRKKISVLNLIDRVEIWAEEEFKIYERKANETFTKVAEELELDL